MFGRKWEPALGTITGVEPDPRHHDQLVYLVDVPLESRGGLRARLAPTRSMSPDLPPGTQVKVEVNARTGEARFDADPVEGLSPGQIDPPGGAAWAEGTHWAGVADGPGAGAPGDVNGTVNAAPDGASALGDVAEILRRLGGEAAGGTVAAALANMLAPPAGPGLTGDPAQPGTPGATEIRVTGSDPQVRAVSGAEAAEFMREFFGGHLQAADPEAADPEAADPEAAERPADEA